MKSLLATIFALLSITQNGAFAANSGITTLSAQAPSQTVQITDQKFDPVYGDVPYETTCSRQVLDHTVRSCHNESGESCSGGGEVCSTTSSSVCNSHGCTSVPRRSCHQSAGSCHTYNHEVCGDENVYRSESYACTRTHTIQIGQTLAKTFNHSVAVSLTPAAQAAIASASLAVSIDVSENTVTADLKSSFPDAILNYAVTTLSNDIGSTVENSNEAIVIDLGLAGTTARKMDSMTADSLELGSDGFRFNLPNGAGLENSLTFAIKLVRTPAVWFPTTVYDSSIRTSILSMVSEGATIKAVVPFEKLGVDSIGGNRHSIDLTISLNAGNILNPADFSAELAKRLQLNLDKSRPTF